MVEFALFLPVLILLMIGVVDIGRAFHASITITNAARVGARYGTLNADDTPGMIAAAVDEAQNSGITLQASDVTVTCDDLVSPPGCDRSMPLRVTINYHFDLVTGFLFPGGMDIVRYSEMYVP